MKATHVANLESRDTTVFRRFDFDRDRFAFANECSWDDGSFHNGSGLAARRRIYRKRCLVMSRAAIQFWKFARFDPTSYELSNGAVLDRIRLLRSIEAWRAPLPNEERVPFPGFESLYEFSKHHSGELRHSLGRGWTTYLRPGNLKLLLPPTRHRRSRLHRALKRSLDAGVPVALWLYTFPHMIMTHSVVAYEWEPSRHGGTLFRVYDPNYHSTPKRLAFDAETQCFSYQRTYFFSGGKIDVAAVYPLGHGS